MHIWIDADACPRLVKDIVFRASHRTSCQVTLVANQPISIPASTRIRAVQVERSLDAADHYIVKTAVAGDLLITADIPLAADAIDQGVFVISPRGEEYSSDNIRQRLNMRDFLDTLRGSGIMSGGPAPWSNQDSQTFANALDRFLARHCK